MRNSQCIEDYKKQAKSLRAQLGPDALTHAAALELVAKQHGFRNWNTLHGSLGSRPDSPDYSIGTRVNGKYLGHPFKGVIKSSRLWRNGGHTQVTVRFDDPIDVVAFDSFSSYRQQVTAILRPDGTSARATSNGVPHMVLNG